MTDDRIHLEKPCGTPPVSPCFTLADFTKELLKLKMLSGGSSVKIATFKAAVQDGMTQLAYPKGWRGVLNEILQKRPIKSRGSHAHTHKREEIEKPSACEDPLPSISPKNPIESSANGPVPGGTSPLTLSDLRAQWQTYILEPDPDVVDITLGAAATHDWGGTTPVWLLIVGPPSTRKTELINALDCHPKTYKLDSFTANTFISGLGDEDAVGGEEPSLLSQYPNHIYTFEDLTVMLTEVAALRKKAFGKVGSEFDKRSRPR